MWCPRMEVVGSEIERVLETLSKRTVPSGPSAKEGPSGHPPRIVRDVNLDLSP